jgi:2-polyprenyl-3-methyl-5-hydroxy-6-metoxy-1,4-benzoquinol methylase
VSTLVVDLDGRVARSPKLRSKTVAEYFKKSNLKWWEALAANRSFKEQERAIRGWIPHRRGKIASALEIGPGTGRITAIIRPACERLTLIEINERFAKRLKKRFPGASLIVADATRCSWGAAAHDLVVATEILVHIPDVRHFLRKAAAALAPKGIAILSITPLDWYQRHVRRATTIHRGIDAREFERFAGRFLAIRKCHTSRNGQQRTYFLHK